MAQQELVQQDERTEIASQAVTPMAMISRAVESGANMETLEKLMALQERYEANQGRKAFDRAIAAAKADIPAIVKNRQVSFGNNKAAYAHEDLAQIAKTVDPILSEHGLSYRFRTSQDGNSLSVTCVLSHRDGYSEETTLSSAPDTSGSKNAIQAVGSATTYLQRYTLKAALGLATTADDDGATASEPPKAPRLTDAQASEILDLITESGTPEETILRFAFSGKPAEAVTVHDIPQSMYERIEKRLLATIKQREAQS